MQHLYPLQNLLIVNLKRVKHLTCVFFFISLTFQSTRALAQAPTITNFTPTTGSVGTLITITNLNNPTSITIGGSNAIPMSIIMEATMVMPGATTGGTSVTTTGSTAQNYTFLNIPI